MVVFVVPANVLAIVAARTWSEREEEEERSGDERL
jgi:hypothetical protein